MTNWIERDDEPRGWVVAILRGGGQVCLVCHKGKGTSLARLDDPRLPSALRIFQSRDAALVAYREAVNQYPNNPATVMALGYKEGNLKEELSGAIAELEKQVDQLD